METKYDRQKYLKEKEHRLKYAKSYYRKNKQRVKKWKREWRAKNKDKILEYHRKYNAIHTEEKSLRARGIALKKNYQISLSDYDKLLKLQNGVCAICKKKNGDKRMLAVDHDHKTGKVRGLLCFKCNLAIGYFGDDVELLKGAIGYLETVQRILA